MTIIIKCIRCNRKYALDVIESHYLKWKKGGEMVQDAMPELSPAYRELLISQLCNSCFDVITDPGEEDEEKDDEVDEEEKEEDLIEDGVEEEEDE